MVVDHLLGNDIGLGQNGLGRGAVTGFPGEDVVRVATRPVRPFLLVGDVLAKHRRIVGLRLERVDQYRKLFILNLDCGHAIGGGIAVIGDDEGDFLRLEQHLAIGKHHLLVTGQCRHPVKTQRLQIGRGQHRMHTRQSQCLFGVDRFDAGMGIRRANKVAEQHAGHLDVVDVIALTLRETRVLDALARRTEATQSGGALFLRRGCFVHYADSFISFIFAAASRMALTIFW